MPPRPPLPADDLYARLEIPVDAGPEVIELAWRSLLRRHHPDVAGEAVISLDGTTLSEQQIAEVRNALAADIPEDPNRL